MLAHDVRTASAAPVLSLVILLSLISALSGCGSGGQPAQPTGQAPLIITQPADQSIPMGLQVTFSVTATGPNNKYQWSRNGTPIDGATASTYSTASVLAADAGSTFSVALTNAFGSATSSAAALTVSPRERLRPAIYAFSRWMPPQQSTVTSKKLRLAPSVSMDG